MQYENNIKGGAYWKKFILADTALTKFNQNQIGNTEVKKIPH